MIGISPCWFTFQQMAVFVTGGSYFVPICVKKRECLFGEISNSEMNLNDAGICSTMMADYCFPENLVYAKLPGQNRIDSKEFQGFGD